MSTYDMKTCMIASALREISDAAYETYARHATRGYCSCKVCLNLRTLDAKRKSYEDWQRQYRGVKMNRVIWNHDRWQIEVEVDGVPEWRNYKLVRGKGTPRYEPELRKGEELVELFSGVVKIVTVNRNGGES